MLFDDEAIWRKTMLTTETTKSTVLTYGYWTHLPSAYST